MGGDHGSGHDAFALATDKKNSDNYDYITFYDQLSHPFSFQPRKTTVVVSSKTQYFSGIYKFIEKVQLNLLHFIKQYMITSLYIITFINPDLSFL